MKKVISIFCLLMVGMILSCSKLIKEEPKGFLNDQSIFNTVGGANAAILGCYSGIATYYYFGVGYFQFLSLGSGAFWTGHTASMPVAKMTAQATDALVNNTWREAYASINSVNGLIDGMLKSTLPETTKNPILGEGYFLRAVLYFNNVRIWGAVPLRLHSSSSNDVYIAKTPATQVYEQVISDLQQAKTLMPEPAAQVKGRPNKYAAYALLAKVYMTLAGNDVSSQYWQKAYDEAIQVYNSNTYKLVRPYKDLWNVDKENSIESIFEIQYSMAGGESNGLTQISMPTNSTYTPNQKTSPTSRVRLHKATFDDHFNLYPGDPRIAMYIYGSYKSNSGSTTQLYPSATASASNGYPFTLKYDDLNYVSSVSNSNFIYLRYADVLLMLAEIENELHGPTGAYKYVNEVMNRARDANGNGTIETTEVAPEDWSGMTQDVFRQRIMLERRIELIGEVHEFFDTRRRGEAYLLSFLQHHNDHPKFNATNDFLFPTDATSVKRLLLMPIPSDEINANRLITAEDQNFGY